jgi:hypothetical protein
MKISCVFFLDELIMAVMTDDVGVYFGLFDAFRGLSNKLTGTIPSLLGLLTRLSAL